MKQIKFFASMALVALAAACTNEDLQMEAPVTGQETRPEANFVIGVNELSPETRADFGVFDGQYQWGFEKGDKIGAMLMDEWLGDGEGINSFRITDYAQTNYPIIRQENGEWSAHEDINTLAGNYFFYFPYEPTTNARGHFGFSVNPNQPQYNEEGNLFAYQPVEDNQKYLAYDFVPVKPYDGKPTNVKLNFVPVFAMPTFQFVNKTAAELIVHKVAIRTTQDPNAGLYNKEVNDLLATTMALVPSTGNFASVRQYWTNKAENFDIEREYMWTNAIRYTNGVANESYVWPKGAKNSQTVNWGWEADGRPFYPLSKGYQDSYLQAPTYEYVADYTGVKGGYKVKPFNKINALLVMPAGYYEVSALEALIYVSPVEAEDDQYVVRIPLLTDSYVSDDVASIAGHKYLAPGKITKFFAEFDAAGMQSFDITKFQITSSEDLKWIIEQAEQYTGEYSLVINTSGSRVVLTKEIEDILASIPQVKLFVNGKITIAADASEDAINKLHFTDRNVETTLTILNKQIITKNVENCIDITVEETGALESKKDQWGNNLYSVTAENIDNNGTVDVLDINADVVNDGIIKARFITGSVENNRLVVNWTLVRAGDIVVDETITGNVKNDAQLKAKNIDGDVTNENAGVLDVTKRISGNVINNGLIKTVETIAGELTNRGTATAKNVATFKNYATLTLNGNNGVIADGLNQKGTINIDGAYTAEILTNEGGKININKNLTVEGTLLNKTYVQSWETKHAYIKIAADATVLAKDEAVVKNEVNNTIDVYGKLAEKVKNSGLINVFGNAKVVVDGLADADIKGIIDVTETTGSESDAQKAMDYKTGDEGNAFRYIVKESTNATELKAALLARISSNNCYEGTGNDIIVEFNAGKSVTYYGVFQADPKLNIAFVKVVSGTELTLTATGSTKAVSFPTLSTDDSNTVPMYKGFEVAANATLIVADNVKFELPAMNVWVNGIFNVNDHAVLKGQVEVKGNGVTTSTTAKANRDWNISASDWTGKDTGWEN